MQQDDDDHQTAQQEQQPQQSPSAESYAGGGLVGVFVAAWMGLIGLVLRLLQPVMSLVLLLLSPLTQASPARTKHKLQKLVRSVLWLSPNHRGAASSGLSCCELCLGFLS
jgi:hypothetical protein